MNKMPQPSENKSEDEPSQGNEKYTFKEPIVLSAILGLSLLHGMSETVDQNHFKIAPSSDNYLRTCSILGPAPGTMIMGFMSERTGRKPAFITLFVLSTLSSILSAIPPGENLLRAEYLLHNFIKGGTLMMTYLAISEYSTPKHRFAFLVLNAAIFEGIGYNIPRLMLFTEVLSPDSIYFQVLGIILGIACLVTISISPESPYWLASKGKFAESKKSFLWLRGEQGEKEFRAIREEKRRPGPPRLYWLSLLTAIATISIGLFDNIQESFIPKVIKNRILLKEYIWYLLPVPKIKTLLFSAIVMSFLVIIISYKVNRKVLLTVTSLISIILFYSVAVWLCFDPLNEDKDPKSFYTLLWICVIIRNLAVFISMAMFIETVPLKYNTQMTYVCLIYYYFLIWLFGGIIEFKDTLLLNPAFNVSLFTTLSLIGVIIYHVLAKDSKGKTLLEIQKLYTPRESIRETEPVQVALENVCTKC